MDQGAGDKVAFHWVGNDPADKGQVSEIDKGGRNSLPLTSEQDRQDKVEETSFYWLGTGRRDGQGKEREIEMRKEKSYKLARQGGRHLLSLTRAK